MRKYKYTCPRCRCHEYTLHKNEGKTPELPITIRCKKCRAWYDINKIKAKELGWKPIK